MKNSTDNNYGIRFKSKTEAIEQLCLKVFGAIPVYESSLEELKTREIQSCPECDALASHGSNDGPCETHKSVEELNDKIMETIEEDDNFEAYLFGKYPKLFPCDEHGQLLPQSQRCWNDCPDGWRDIVDSLFGCIDDYVSNYKHTEINPKQKLRYKSRKAYWKYVRDPIYRKFNPYRDFEKRLPKGAKFASPSNEEREKINKSFAARLRSLVSKIDNVLFNRHDLYIGVSPSAVTIDQYKEKFGTLRIYHSGGDDKVDGMIRYAEHLSSLTCQSTGKRGQLCKRGWWYATLSDEEAQKADYKQVDEGI